MEWWSGGVVAVLGGDDPFWLAVLKDRERGRARERARAGGGGGGGGGRGRQGGDALATTCKVEQYNVVESAILAANEFVY
jgi:hypothetical protein